MNDAIDDGMEDYGGEADIDKAYAEVCDELKIEISADISDPSGSKIGGKKAVY